MSPYSASKATAVVLSISVFACGHDDAKRPTPTREAIAGGEVVAEPASKPAVNSARWISDANTLSLLSALNARAIAAADVELENWHVDTARAFAASMAREHAELQHSIDSLAGRLNLTPVTPALAKDWTSVLQAQIDTVRRAGDAGIDLAFVRQQANSHRLMSDYITQLAAVAERPELRALLETAAAKTTSQAQRASALQPTVARIDSVRRAARRRGTTP
jgi:predicted outer membrane protein